MKLLDLTHESPLPQIPASFAEVEDEKILNAFKDIFDLLLQKPKFEINDQDVKNLVRQVGGESIDRNIIRIYAGSEANLPAGWQVCDGTNGTPDLQGRYLKMDDTFVWGNIGNTGGASTHEHLSSAASGGADFTNAGGFKTDAGDNNPPNYIIAWITRPEYWSGGSPV